MEETQTTAWGCKGRAGDQLPKEDTGPGHWEERMCRHEGGEMTLPAWGPPASTISEALPVQPLNTPQTRALMEQGRNAGGPSSPAATPDRHAHCPPHPPGPDPGSRLSWRQPQLPAGTNLGTAAQA